MTRHRFHAALAKIRGARCVKLLDKQFVPLHAITYLEQPKLQAMLIVYIFIGLVVLLLIIAAILPKTYNIEKTIIINRPVHDVMDSVGNLNNYSQWNPWQQSDPTAKSTITGNPKTPGHQYRWQGRKTGIGSLTLRDLDDKHIHFDLRFIKPWKAWAKDNWLFEEWGNGETKVTWQNNGELPFPLARLMGPMLKKTLNKQFAEGLRNLKTLCESHVK